MRFDCGFLSLDRLIVVIIFCFVPKQINNLFVKNSKNKEVLPIGVYKDDKKFRASSKKLGNYYIGLYSTPEEAFQAYKVAKEKHIKEVADKWRGQITEQVYEALINYKI